MDFVSKEKRSKIMRGVKQENTKPEILVRRIIHSSGYRFRLHRKDLPGRPDIVLPKYQLAIFVHGCFWHQHDGCHDDRMPTSNTEYWTQKLQRNKERDKEKFENLKDKGWNVLIIWECETKNTEIVYKKINKYIKI
ncbi:very short patch repair endonuclease [Fodinicurvata sediminis]|uniref:very short patch repair endonuclease n=1 Tax=Fodinicurvata sediminis TaxID=1121832 RepID=UPI0003B789A9|nr:very short patch repair endonuclease [Fodinicurvata sediminis]